MTPEHELDPEALGDYFDRLYRAAWGLCGSREDAEDLVQDTYARVLARPHVAPGAEPEALDLPDERRAAAEPAAAAEAREVYRAISELSDDFRDALVAIDVAGLSYTEAARALKVAEGTITSRLFRARREVAK